jgi:glycosyltransferase involved in cell wall biosynthesis
MGVNVVGPLRSESGVGEASRAVVAGLDAAGVTLLPVHPPDVPPSRQGVLFDTVEPSQAGFSTNVLCLTSVETAPFAERVGPAFFAGRRTIGLWYWEVGSWPEVQRGGLAHVDEVWAPSGHIARALVPHTRDVPVKRVRVPVRRPLPPPRSRASLGLPTDGTVFLVAFGYFSSVARKNPLGTIEAFCRAFPQPDSGAHLVVKCIDEEHHPVEHAEVEAACARHPDVHLLPGYVDRDEMDALLAACDAVVSLHRAEGFGFLPAEAMAMGKAVVVSAYSGTLDFTTEANSLLVGGTEVPIGEAGAPYPADGLWFEPDLDQAAEHLQRLHAAPRLGTLLGAQAAQDLHAGWSVAAAGATLAAALPRDHDRGALRARVHAARLRRRRA